MNRPRRTLKGFFAALLIVVTLPATSYAATYVVQSGDSLYLIAQRTGTTVRTIQEYNGIGNSIYPGQTLEIPSASGSRTTTHTVRTGETLFIIAQNNGITVEALKRANNLTGDYIEVGQTLTIPSSSAVSTGSTARGTSYTVKSGDTLYLIAKRFGISLNTLRQANNLWTDSLMVGQRLIIPRTSSGSSGSSKSSTTSRSFSQADLNLWARLVQAEAGGEPYAGKVAVAATVLNRLTDPRYPKTISGIILQVVNGHYQYSPVLDGRINQPATAEAYRAVQDAIGGWDPSNGANGFYNPAKTSNQWVQSHPATAVIGNHVFFKY